MAEDLDDALDSLHENQHHGCELTNGPQTGSARFRGSSLDLRVCHNSRRSSCGHTDDYQHASLLSLDMQKARREVRRA